MVIPLSAIFKDSTLGRDLEGGRPLDLLFLDELLEALGEVLHPLFLADPDGVGELDVAFGPDQLADGRVGPEDLDGRDAGHPRRGEFLGRGEELLGDDRP